MQTIHFTGASKLAIKIGPAEPMLAAKVVQGNQFWQIFCQNQSGQTDLRGTDFGVTGLANILYCNCLYRSGGMERCKVVSKSSIKSQNNQMAPFSAQRIIQSSQIHGCLVAGKL